MAYGNRSRKSTDTGITFPQLECWSPMREQATFAAEVNGTRVTCRIESEALTDCSPDHAENPMRALAASRRDVQAAARRLIESDRYEDDGSILIRRSDLAT